MTPRLLTAALLLAVTAPLHAEVDPLDLYTLCAKDPARCAELQDKALALKNHCDQNPEQCAELKQKFSTKAEQFKAQCEADPEACEAKKQAVMDLLRQYSVSKE